MVTVSGTGSNRRQYLEIVGNMNKSKGGKRHFVRQHPDLEIENFLNLKWCFLNVVVHVCNANCMLKQED
jgi:hypothetical protein